MHLSRYLSALVFITPILCAQNYTKIPVTVSVGDYSRLGYKRPDVSFQMGAEHFRQKYWLNVSGHFNPTDKIYYGNVTQMGVSSELFWKSRRGFFAGGGGNIRNITFHDLGPNQSYWTTGPTASCGLLVRNLRVTVRGRFWEYDRRYDVRGVSWSLLYDIKGKVRVGFGQGVYSVYSKGAHINFGTNLVGSAIIGYVF